MLYEPDQQMTFGDLLRRARRAVGMTQEELAERAGLSVRGISDLERGARRVPRRDTLNLLAQALEITGPELTEWQRARRTPETQPSSPPLPPMPSTTLVGRERESEILRDTIDQGSHGHGQLVLLAGEPGVGKTRLAEYVAAYSRSRDVRVLWGRCHEGEGAPAYWPWVQILRSLVDALAPDVLRSDLGRGANAIAQLVPEISDKLHGLPQARKLSPEQARFELFDSVTRFLKSVSLRAPLLIVLDDLHWADQSSLDLLLFFGHEIESRRIVILGTYRDTEIDLVPHLSEVVAGLNRSRHCQQQFITGLSEADVGHLIERVIARSPESATVTAVFERTEGNPFFVDELARLMLATARSDGSSEEDAVLSSIPPGVQGVLEQRYRRLSAECYGVVSAAAVIGREFNLSMLEAITTMQRTVLLFGLDEALRARLIERLSGSVGRYRFSHALVRETLYAALPSAERATLHRLAGEYLERVHFSEPGPQLTMLAHHFFQAIPAGEAHRAIDYALRAGERAASQFAHAEAVVLYRQALDALELRLPIDAEMRCDILLTLGEACNQAGQYQRAQDAFIEVARTSRELGLPAHLARAAIGAAGLGVIEHGEIHHLQLLEDAVSAVPKDAGLLRPHLLARLAISLGGADDQERRWALVDEAEPIARSVGDDAALLYVLLARHRSLWSPQFRSRRLDVANELATLAERVSGSASVPVIPYMMHDALEAGDMPAFDPLLDQFSSRVRDLRQPQRLWIESNMRAARAFVSGRFNDAEELVDQAYEIGKPAAPTLAYADRFLFRFFLSRERGDLGRIAIDAREIDLMYPDDHFWQALLTQVASQAPEAFTARFSPADLARDVCRPASMDGTAVVAAGVLATSPEISSDLDSAERLYRALAPYWQSNAVMSNSRHFFCTGSISHSLGLLAFALDHREKAERHFQDAISMHERMGAVPHLAHSRFQYARLLADRGAVGDARHARGLAGEALETADVLGMNVLARDIRALISDLEASS